MNTHFDSYSQTRAYALNFHENLQRKKVITQEIWCALKSKISNFQNNYQISQEIMSVFSQAPVFPFQCYQVGCVCVCVVYACVSLFAHKLPDLMNSQNKIKTNKTRKKDFSPEAHSFPFKKPKNNVWMNVIPFLYAIQSVCYASFFFHFLVCLALYLNKWMVFILIKI